MKKKKRGGARREEDIRQTTACHGKQTKATQLSVSQPENTVVQHCLYCRKIFTCSVTHLFGGSDGSAHRFCCGGHLGRSLGHLLLRLPDLRFHRPGVFPGGGGTRDEKMEDGRVNINSPHTYACMSNKCGGLQHTRSCVTHAFFFGSSYLMHAFSYGLLMLPLSFAKTWAGGATPERQNVTEPMPKDETGFDRQPAYRQKKTMRALNLSLSVCFS